MTASANTRILPRTFDSHRSVRRLAIREASPRFYACETGDRSTAFAIEKAKPKACECGADALYVEAASTSRGGIGMATVVAIRYAKGNGTS